MSEGPSSTSAPKPGPGASDNLIGLVFLAATVAVPVLVGFIAELVNHKQGDPAPAITHAKAVPEVSDAAATMPLPLLLLQRAARDISAQDRRGELPHILGREREIYQLVGYLGGGLRQSVLLSGEDGIGKTAMVEGLVQAIHSGKYPALEKFVVLEVDPAQIVGEPAGDAAQDGAALVEAMCEAQDSAILFLDNFQDLIQRETSSRRPLDLSAFEQALSSHRLRCIVVMDARGYKQLTGSHPALARLLIDQPLEKRKSPGEPFGEVSQDIVYQILAQHVHDFPETYGLRVKPQAIEAAMAVSEKYLPNERLPGKAIRLLDETARRMRPQRNASPLELVSMEKDLADLEARKLRLQAREPATVSRELSELNTLIPKTRELKQKLEKDWEEVKKQQQALFDLMVEIAALTRAIETSLLNDAGVLTALYRQELSAKSENRRKLEQVLESQSTRFGNLRVDVEAADVARSLSEKLGFPIQLADEDEMEKLRRLEDSLKQRVIGQDEAIQAVADAIKRSRVGLNPGGTQPIISLMFIGTTGVGKTELAKALAETWFGDEKAMLRFDMTEYQEKHSMLRLIGSPPSYVGYEEGGQLTQAVSEHPYSVVLFDEFDKAHPDIYKLFFQMVDDGRMTDGKGRTVNFTHTIIIFTSNAGSELIQELRGRDASLAEIESGVENLLRQQYDAPFIGRLNRIVLFNGLQRETLEKIMDIELNRLKANLASRDIAAEVSPAAKAFILQHADTERKGARDIRHQIEAEIINKITDGILAREIQPGDALWVDCPTGPIEITKRKK